MVVGSFVVVALLVLFIYYCPLADVNIYFGGQQ